MFFTKSKKVKKSIWREYLETIIWVIVLVILIRTWGVQAFKIPSSSMEPTLLIGDHLLVSRSSYGIHIPHELQITTNERLSAPAPTPEWAGKIIVPFASPARGDIIVFRSPENRAEDYIKRVIGLPGERVEVKGKTIIINGRPLDDPWGHFIEGYDNIYPLPRSRNFGPVVVPEGHYFVMGDNRDNSSDSRLWFNGRGGFVPEEDILGRAFITYWSWAGDSWDVRWSRLGSIIR